MTKLVISEKPSVGMSLSAVLGADKRMDGYMEGNGYIVNRCREPSFLKSLWSQNQRNHALSTRTFGNLTSCLDWVQLMPSTSFHNDI